MHWKNLAIDHEDDQAMVETLAQSDDLLDGIFLRFLYLDFMKTYTPIFEYRKNSNTHSRYVWADDEYRAFMFAMLRSLEPRKEEPDVVLVDELDEFNEVIFFMKGFYCVGYSINNQKYFYPELYSTNVIGAYGATFNKRALFIYKTKTQCEGFFIRKRNW